MYNYVDTKIEENIVDYHVKYVLRYKNPNHIIKKLYFSYINAKLVSLPYPMVVHK